MVHCYGIKRFAMVFAWLVSALATAQAQTTQPASCVAATDLQVWLPLDEASGTQARDISGNNRPGTVTGGVWQQQTGTVRPRSLLLSGTNKVSVPVAGQPQAFTVAFWVRPSKLTNYNCMVAARLASYSNDPWGGFAFHTHVDGGVAVGINHQSANGRITTRPGVLRPDEWQHVVFTYDNGTGTFYHNGGVIASLTGMPAPQPWQSFMISTGVNGQDFGGNISDFRLYHRALLPTEVNALKQCPATPLPTPTCSIPPLQTSPNATLTAGQSTTLQVQTQQGALRFDGAGDQVIIGSATTTAFANVVNTFTVEAWVKPTATHEIDPQQSSGVAGTANQRYLMFPVHGESTWAAGHAGIGVSVGTNGISEVV